MGNEKLPNSSYFPIFHQVCKEGNEPEPVAVDCGRCGQLLLSCGLPGSGCSFPSTSKGTTPKLQQRALKDIFFFHPAVTCAAGLDPHPTVCSFQLSYVSSHFILVNRQKDMILDIFRSTQQNHVFKCFLSPHQEIDGKSLLLMQRSDVLTGLSIRLGPALKIYERHVKVLQRTHFLECEDLWSRDAADSAVLIRKRTQWPLPFGSCRLPSYPLYVESGRVRRRDVVVVVVDLTFHCENDQKLNDSHPTSHRGL